MELPFVLNQNNNNKRLFLPTLNNSLLPEAFPTSDDFGASRNSAYAFFSHKNNF